MPERQARKVRRCHAQNAYKSVVGRVSVHLKLRKVPVLAGPRPLLLGWHELADEKKPGTRPGEYMNGAPRGATPKRIINYTL